MTTTTNADPVAKLLSDLAKSHGGLECRRGFISRPDLICVLSQVIPGNSTTGRSLYLDGEYDRNWFSTCHEVADVWRLA
nr:hypothetical protein [Laribacter hongkongensis]